MVNTSAAANGTEFSDLPFFLILNTAIGGASRRRDCHSAAPPSPFSRRFNMDVEGVSAK